MRNTVKLQTLDDLLDFREFLMNEPSQPAPFVINALWLGNMTLIQSETASARANAASDILLLCPDLESIALSQFAFSYLTFAHNQYKFALPKLSTVFIIESHPSFSMPYTDFVHDLVNPSSSLFSDITRLALLCPIYSPFDIPLANYTNLTHVAFRVELAPIGIVVYQVVVSGLPNLQRIVILFDPLVVGEASMWVDWLRRNRPADKRICIYPWQSASSYTATNGSREWKQEVVGERSLWDAAEEFTADYVDLSK
jgi:hypothetical protein